jgi:hypothetical protein
VPTVTVTPESFAMVKFDHDRIVELVSEVAGKVGLPADAEIKVEIDETTPLGRTKIVSVDPIVLSVQGGAFENPKVPRTLSEKDVVDVAGRLLFRVKDRLDPRFADAPPDEELTLAHHTAWDAYAVGRCEQIGYEPAKPRRLYHFRNRHGFTDVADAVFERLWTSSDLSWADLAAACAETESAKEPAA